MVYSVIPQNPERTCKARADDQRVHFKNTREAAMAIKGMTLRRAKAFLHHVIARKEIVPFRRFNGGIGRKAQCKNADCQQGRWPKKSAELLLNLLQNAQANAAAKQLNTNKVYVSHIQVQLAQKGRRRTYRAHGRINAYMNSPCSVEMILTEQRKSFKRSPEAAKAEKDAKAKKTATA
eukprot:m51a1_g356 putative 60S ribosomal protein L22 (178) ;mRNA; f:579784-580584